MFSIHQVEKSLQNYSGVSTGEVTANRFTLTDFVPRSLTARSDHGGDSRFKILSIDGGGIRGIVPLKVLVALEDIIGRTSPLSDHFDLIAGTSTGGIIGLSLAGSASRLKASDLLNLYENRSNEIFVTNPYQRVHNIAAELVHVTGLGRDTLLRGLIDAPFYSRSGVEKIAKEIFNDLLMKDMRTNVLIPAVDTTNSTTRRFTNREKKDAFLPIQDVAIATSAAPTFFPHKVIDGHTYVDGGLSCNNPAEQAFWYATINRIPMESSYIVSLGTGFSDVGGKIPRHLKASNCLSTV